MQYYDKLDIAKIRSLTEHTIKVYRAMIEVSPKIVEVCRRFDGKQIGKRFSDALKAALPEHSVRVEAVSTSFENIVIWPYDQYADRKNIFLGYYSEGTISCFNFERWHEKFRKENNYAGFLDEAEFALANIGATIEDYNEALARFAQARKDLHGLTGI